MCMDKLKIAGQYVLPQHALSKLMGKLASWQGGSVTTAIIKGFIKKYQVNMDEAADPNLESYTSFNEFFTRPLKEGAREICEGDNLLACPVDGAVSQLGDIIEGRIFQAKGCHFTLQEIIGGDEEDAKPFVDGKFATIYLSPKDYHRIHNPMQATLRKMIYVPGDLFSVNPLTAENVPRLFARNERVVTIYDTPHGPFAHILVGATIVGSMETVWHGTVTPSSNRERKFGAKTESWDYPAQGDQAIELAKGEEIGRFKLGSTVVLLFPKDMLEFEEAYQAGESTRMGTPFATLNNS
jgi:phosphatidylserine decarboxylase